MMEFVFGILVGSFFLWLWREQTDDWNFLGRLFKKATEKDEVDPAYDVVEYVGLPIPVQEKRRDSLIGPSYGVYMKARNNTAELTVRKDTLQEAIDEAQKLNELYKLGPFKEKEPTP